MVQRDVGNGASSEGGDVLDRLHYGVRFPDISERGHPGPEAQLRPFHGHGVPVRRLSEVTLTLTRVQDAPPTPTPWRSDEDASGHDLRRVAARRTEAGKTGDVPQLVDLGGDVGTRR